MVNVLVTGSSGMLGGHLVEALREGGHDVVGLDVRPARATPPGVRQILGDVRDADAVRTAVRGAEVVVHCAAALPSYASQDIRSIIVGGTSTVLSAASAAGVDRVVHVSSTAVYGLPERVPTREDHPRTPVDDYSRAKAEAEEVCEDARRNGLCVPVLRPKTFLGPGRMGLFSMLFEWADDGRHFPVLGRGDVRIQMLAVEDLVAAVHAAVTAPPDTANDTFNIAAADFGSLREDFQAVLDRAGYGRRVIGLPARPALAVLRGLGRMGMSPVYDRLLHKLLADSYVSIEKARDQLGFTPRWSNQDAILRTYDWWRAERAGRRDARPAAGGRTSRDPWQQGALVAVKALF